MIKLDPHKVARVPRDISEQEPADSVAIGKPPPNQGPLQECKVRCSVRSTVCTRTISAPVTGFTTGSVSSPSRTRPKTGSLPLEPRNTCRHRCWAPKAGRTLGGATLTFSDAAGLGREPYRRQDRGHMREVGEFSRAAMRTNDLVKAILKIVELRGLEPLTFSLRRLRVQLVRREHRVLHVHV